MNTEFVKNCTRNNFDILVVIEYYDHVGRFQVNCLRSVLCFSERVIYSRLCFN